MEDALLLTERASECDDGDGPGTYGVGGGDGPPPPPPPATIADLGECALIAALI